MLTDIFIVSEYHGKVNADITEIFISKYLKDSINVLFQNST